MQKEDLAARACALEYISESRRTRNWLTVYSLRVLVVLLRRKISTNPLTLLANSIGAKFAIFFWSEF